jgi:glutathione S-transferase
MPTLVQAPYSPWSIRARLALEAQGVDHRTRTYIPSVSEPWLRWRLGDWRGRLTIPVLLVEGGPPLRDSFEIAAWGAERSTRPLLDAHNREACAEINALGSRALDAGRVRTMRLVRDDAAALSESLPAGLRALGPVGRMVGRKVTGDLLGKYGVADVSIDEASDRLRLALIELRQRLDGRPWLLGDFSYADVTGAMALAFVSPHASAPIGRASRPHWTHPALAVEFAELVAWRDRMLDEVARRRSAFAQPAAEAGPGA